MRVRNYEKNILIYLFILFLTVIEVLFFFYLYNKKMYIYESLNGVVVKDNLVLLIVSEENNKILNKNKYMFINGEKIKYKIYEDRGYVIKNKKEKYKEILLEFKFDKKYKTNDSLQLVLKKEKIRIIEIFKIIWEGE